MTITVQGFEVTLADLVRETTQTTGTGTYSLDGAPAGFFTFASRVGSGNRTVYVARLGSTEERGIGTVTSGAPATLTRDLILGSTNGGAAVNWGAGVKDIYVDLLSAVPQAQEDQIDDHETRLVAVETQLPQEATEVNDYSANVTQMQTKTDPGGVGTESLATSLAGELERLRFVIARLLGETNWYETPDATIAALAGTVASGTVAFDGSFFASAAHGLGAIPTFFDFRLKCDVPQGNFAVGDEVRISGWQTDADANDVVSFWADATSVGIAGNDMRLAQKGSAADGFVPSAANWTWKWYARIL